MVKKVSKFYIFFIISTDKLEEFVPMRKQKKKKIDMDTYWTQKKSSA